MDPKALFRIASRLHKEGKIPEAKAKYEKILEAYPRHAQTRHLLGVVAYQEGRLQDAITLIEGAIKLESNAASFHNNLGNVYKDLGECAKAIVCYQRAVQLRPDYPGAYYNLGAVHESTGNFREAIQALRQSLNLEPENVDLHLRLAGIYRQRKHLKRAAFHYREALKRDDTLLEAHINLGGILLHQGFVDDAEKYYRSALELDERSSDAHFNMALVSRQQKKWGEAADFLKSTLNLQPENLRARYEQIKMRIDACDWRERDSDMAEAVDLVRGQISETTNATLEPWAVNQFSSSPAFHAEVARAYGAGIAKSTAEIRERLAFQSAWHDRPTLNIGYVSPDFRTHAVGVLIRDMFRHHNRDRFRIYGYSLADLEDEVQKSIKAGCDVFTSIQRLSPTESALRIHNDKIDILIDLAGYTTFSRPEIFALRPAPVQVQYLGMLGTMGADFIDYTIVDATVVDDALARHFDEKMVYMPDTFMVASPFPEPDTEADRGAYGLPESGVVFCCFNSSYKIDPHAFDSWMRILAEVPDALLWLYASDREDAKDNLRREADTRGIDRERLFFAETLPFADHIARFAVADIFLDTFQYNAGATAVGALWAGVPLITLYGETLMQRMGASMLAASRCGELVAHSESEYERKAVELASDPRRLAGMKNGLRSARGDLPLFQTSRFMNHLEDAFERMWTNLRDGTVEDIVIPGRTESTGG